MNVPAIPPHELLTALDTFMAEQGLETRGKAIRLLMTDMLTQLGYLPPVSVERVPREDLIYRSSNGDDWSLVTDGGGSLLVVHQANQSSGGARTIIELEEFLSRTGASPEGQAVQAAITANPQPSKLSFPKMTAG